MREGTVPLAWSVLGGGRLADGGDVPPELLAEGIQAFFLQALSLQFCALHSSTSAQDRLVTYLRAWLR